MSRHQYGDRVSWRRIVPVSLAVLTMGTVGWDMSRPDGAGPGLRGTGAQIATAAGSFDTDPQIDSARGEVDAGRAWHASRLLRAVERSGTTLAPQDVLLLARADAGWRNWAGVVERLAGQAWIDDVGDGSGLLLLGRAHEERREWNAAADAYNRYVRTPHGAVNPILPGILVRHARALANTGRGVEARAALEGISRPVVASWGSLAAAVGPADSGRVADVRALLGLISDSVARLNAWELLPKALLAAGDSAGSERAYRDAAARVTGNRRAKAWTVAGDIARVRGASSTARYAYGTALLEGPNTPAASRAAAGLLSVGGADAEQALVAARALDRTNDYGPAVRAYDLHMELRGGPDRVGETVRLARAVRLAMTRGRETEAIEEFRALSTSPRPQIGAGALERWARLRERQGRMGDVATLQRWLVERYPTTPEAADVLFFRGDARHDRNELDVAVAAYLRLIETAPSQDRAGLASMRVGQIHLLRGRYMRAAEQYEAYLASFPNGRRWQEASYWAARVRLALGDTTRSRQLVSRLRRDDPLSYYTVLAADLTGEDFRLNLAADEASSPTPPWLLEGIEHVDLLRAAGLDEGEMAEIDRLTARARTDEAAMYSLAEALIERDHTILAINMGHQLRRDGVPWTLRLARIIYPWRYRDVFEREAHENGLEPYLIAALARQESAFDPDIRSVANAVGLMQLLPSTATEVARRNGPEDLREELLEVPDVNVHLGTRYLADLLQRNQGDITRFLAGYNAGQRRVLRWREFAEAADPLTFTERIPFAETRNYVKAVRRNVAIYRALYGN